MTDSIGKTFKILRLVLLLMGGYVFLAGPRPAMANSAWATGDVFAGVGQGRYQVYSNSGVFRETFSFGGGFTTGCAFDANGDFYGTWFTETKVRKVSQTHPHPLLQTINTAAQSPGGHSESIVFDAAGNFYVGHPDGNEDIHKYDSAGVFQQKYDVAIIGRGSDWIDLASDQTTMFYTSESRLIRRYDVAADTQLPDFANIGGTGISFALRLLAPGDGSGGLLVANMTSVKRLDGSGNVVQTYDVAGEDTWFSLNLDPNGTSFWAGNFRSANFYRFNIASGAVELGPINTGTGTNTLFGICVLGEITAAIPRDITLAPPSATNDLGALHTLTATVTEDGQPLAGAVVTFEVTSGPNVGVLGADTTGADGKATLSYTSSLTGTDTIVARFTDSEGTVHTSSPVTKEWTLPPEADIEILSKEIVDAPAEIDVSSQVPITVRTVVTNNGPAQTVDTILNKTATAQPGCDISPESDSEQVLDLQLGEQRAVDEIFTVHCSEPSFHDFWIENEIEVTSTGVTDPDLTNNTASAHVTVAAIAYADLEIDSWEVDLPQSVLAPDLPPGQLLLSEEIFFDTRKVIHNRGPFGPVDVEVWKTMDVPLGMEGSVHVTEDEAPATIYVLWPDGSQEVYADQPASTVVKKEGPVQLSLHFELSDVAVSVPVEILEEFDLHCLDEGSYSVTLTNRVAPQDIHVRDTDPTNDEAERTLEVECINPVSKDVRFTDVNFTPTDPDTGEPLPAELGELLPIAHDDEFLVWVPVHPKKGTVQNTNPGQLYTVVSVFGPGFTSFWFHEEFGPQFDVNPAKLGGGIAVIVVDENGFATDLTGALLSLGVAATVDNEANMVWLDVPIAEALGRPLGLGEMLMIYVKFGPSPEFKGQPAPVFPDHWENWAVIDPDHDPGTEPNWEAHATVHLEEKR